MQFRQLLPTNSKHDTNQANALQALITAANSAQGFTRQASNMANKAADLNSLKMKQDHEQEMDKQKFAQKNYDKMKGSLDTQLKNNGQRWVPADIMSHAVCFMIVNGLTSRL